MSKSQEFLQTETTSKKKACSSGISTLKPGFQVNGNSAIFSEFPFFHLAILNPAGASASGFFFETADCSSLLLTLLPILFPFVFFVGEKLS